MKEIYETKKGIALLNILKYMLFFGILYLFNVGGINGNIFPFAFGFFVALCWCEQNVFVMSLLYVCASLCATFSVASLVQSTFCCLVITITYFIHKKMHHRIPMSLVGVYAVLSQTMYLFYSLVDINQIVPSLVYLVFGVLFMYACISIFKLLLVKGVGLKLTIDECICVGTFFVALGAGLSAVHLFGFSVLNIACIFFVLLSTFVYLKSSIPLVVAICFGLGCALNTGNISLMAVFVTLALCSVSFKSTSKYFSIMAIIIGDVVLGLYFNAYGAYNYKILVSTVAGELLFMCISNGTLSYLKVIFGEKSSTAALRNMVNKSRDNLCKKMYSLSEVFDEMDRSFKSTIKGLLPASEAKQMLKEEFMNKVCYDCPEKHRCYRVLLKETNETIDSIISAGLDRGKVTLLDIPPFLSTRCNKTSIILSTINQLIAGYKQYTYCASSIDTSKALVAEEFKGVSRLLLKLADQTKELVGFDEEFENKIIDELNYINIVASEVYVTSKDKNLVSCVLTIRNEDLDNPKLIALLNRNFGTKMQLFSSEPATIQGFVVCTFMPAPKYECIFGSSGVQKFGNSVSGDSYSFTRLNSNKILLAICDGMGSGESAQKMSDTTISLIENFYKAEFDDETIMSSVNKLLSMQMVDGYSALDVCVLDLSNCFADFIKVGAPASFVKHAESTEVISGSGALPIGILEDMKPSTDGKTFSENDIIVLCSDGIIDAFDDDEKLKNFINNLSTTNPQEIADMIVGEAIKLNSNEPKDDMTVLCTRIFVNI